MKVAKIVVFTDDPSEDPLPAPLAQSISIDGTEYWVPAGMILKTEIGDSEPLQVTLTLFASDVEFTPRPK